MLVKSKIKKLEMQHVSCVMLFQDLKVHGHGSVNYWNQGWVQGSQVPLKWTNFVEND